ncbi:hypothetical protein ACQJBY_024990 [Aegilops geniculata]
METMQQIISAGANIVDATDLSRDVSRLRASFPKAHLLIDRAEWGRFKDVNLAVLLSQLKDATYDAEDLLRELDEQLLQQKTEAANRSVAGQFLASIFNRARVWISRSKARAEDAQSKLDKVIGEMEGALNFMGLNIEPRQLGKAPRMPETSSVLSESLVFGRDEEQGRVISLLGVPSAMPRSSAKRLREKSRRSSAMEVVATDLTVLPIVGIGGVGKTTLAQLVYNDPRVKSHFDLRIWVCVSDLFDIKRVTKEILEHTSASAEATDSLASLNSLQVELSQQLKEEKFLLVLDDVWPSACQEWRTFSAPLRYGHHGSMVLVTTRSLRVADLVATIEPPAAAVELQGLPTDIFWDFFSKCAFGRECLQSYPQLQEIGRGIASRLCGSPLAAKTLGRLLNTELTERHWRSIQNNELWELAQQDNEILPALRLSYLYLPQELKRCFALCCMFPKDYSFEKDEIVDLWASQGYVAPAGSMRLEDVGSRYLDDLSSRFLLQADPKFPGLSRYVMHDLIHDMAQSVSVGECFLMQDSSSYQSLRRMPQTVRHMSIEVDNAALSRMKTDLDNLNKLRSLRFGTRFEVEMISWFSQLSNILFLSLKGCKLVKLPESLCVLNHLRYLDISHSSIQEFPEKFWCLYNLQVVDASRTRLQTIHEGVTKLVNLRRLSLPVKSSHELSKISGIGNLCCLRNLSYFRVGSVNGRKIGELKGMNQLSGTLSIRSIGRVQNMAEAAEANLADKQYLEELVLEWRVQACGWRRFENEVLEGLHPPSRIERLRVECFGGDVAPSWFNPENLPNVKSLQLSRCQSLRYLSVCFPSLNQLILWEVGIEELTALADGSHPSLPSLSNLRLFSCRKLTNLEHFLCPQYLPFIKSIEIVWCTSLLSMPVHRFAGFVCLQDLKIHSCWKLVWPSEAIVFPPSLQRLSICYCGELDKSFQPGCLENLASLRLVQLEGCHNVEVVPLNSISTSIKCLVLRHCSELSSIGGSPTAALSSIQHVDISDCPKFIQVQQPLLNQGLSTPKEKELHKFLQYTT